MPKGDLLTQGEVIKLLAKSCRLEPAIINQWCRKKKAFLKEKEHYILKVGVSGKKRNFKQFRREVLPYIHRLYHYDIIRRFDNNTILESAKLSKYSTYHVFFERPVGKSNFKPLHTTFVNVIEQLDKEFDEIVSIRRAASVYGSNVNAIVICQCVDDYDLGIFINQLTTILQGEGSNARILWQRSDSSAPFVRSQPKEKEIIRSFVLVDINYLGTKITLDKLCEEFSKIPDITFASVVYGSAEILLCVDSKDLPTLSQVISQKIRVSDGVLGTSTFICLPDHIYLKD